jgi:hypothetical protein
MIPRPLALKFTAIKKECVSNVDGGNIEKVPCSSVYVAASRKHPERAPDLAVATW